MQVSDVIALVDRVQQVSVNSIDGLAQMISASPHIKGVGGCRDAGVGFDATHTDLPNG